MPESPLDPSSSLDLHRAEEVVDQVARELGSFASRLSGQIVKQLALAREEAEDIWAEARNLSNIPGE